MLLKQQDNMQVLQQAPQLEMQAKVAGCFLSFNGISLNLEVQDL